MMEEENMAIIERVKMEVEEEEDMEVKGVMCVLLSHRASPLVRQFLTPAGVPDVSVLGPSAPPWHVMRGAQWSAVMMGANGVFAQVRERVPPCLSVSEAVSKWIQTATASSVTVPRWRTTPLRPPHPLPL